MPGLGKIEIIGAEEAHRLTQLDREEINRPSPDGRFVLRLSEPWEYAMGAEVWGRVQLLDQGQDVTSEHPFLGDWLGVFKGHFLYPWDCQGRCVSLPVLRHDKAAALVLYDVASRSERSRFDDVWPFSVVWSPSTDTAFLSTDQGKQLFDTTGERHPFPCGPVGSLFAGWTPSARHIVLPLGEERQNVVVGFFDAENGDQTNTETLDPKQILPFDEERFTKQSTGRWLYDPVVDPLGYWPSSPDMVESFTGSWSGALYDPLKCSLFLMVIRPTFELGPPSRLPPGFGPSADPDEPTCLMTQAWVRVSLVD